MNGARQPDSSLRSYEFRREREESWRELESLLQRITVAGVRRLTAEELERLPSLYRGTVSSLSVARAVSLDRNLLLYLENLAARAYLAVYGTRRDLGDSVARFCVDTFPSAVRAHRWHVLIASLILLGGVVVGLALTLDVPDRYYALVPAAVHGGRTPTATTEELRSFLVDRQDLSDTLIAFASFLFSNNAGVGILCFSLGFAAGIPVFYLLLNNGMMLGAMAALYHDRGLSTDFWGWILPHGVTELGAIALCGGAGLAIAQALVFPGSETRTASLAQSGRRAGLIVIGAVGMLFVAALIEGVFRQTVTDTSARYVVAALTLTAWMLYFARSGRG